MPESVKHKSHAEQPQVLDANHSDSVLLSHTFAFTTTNKPTDSTFNKVKDLERRVSTLRFDETSHFLVTPSPCNKLDGTHGLGITDKGFLMCDGERMFVESCPGGTIWDNVNKACVWPDMQDFFGSGRTLESNNNYGSLSVVRLSIVFPNSCLFDSSTIKVTAKRKSSDQLSHSVKQRPSLHDH